MSIGKIHVKKTILFCGMPGAGKSSVGSKCSKVLGRPFFDTDHLLKIQHGKTARELWEKRGECGFRELESDILISLSKRLCKAAPGVVALGGGALIKPLNRELLKGLGTFIYLKASCQILYERLILRGMPPFIPDFDAFKEIYDLRTPLFEAFCQDIFETDMFQENELAHTICGKYE